MLMLKWQCRLVLSYIVQFELISALHLRFLLFSAEILCSWFKAIAWVEN